MQKLRAAMHIKSDYDMGSAFDLELQEKKRLEKLVDRQRKEKEEKRKLRQEKREKERKILEQ